ncbi:MAG: WecB/TagA/CpsF family glycosyltransferase [Planctomycetota bacterium]
MRAQIRGIPFDLVEPHTVLEAIERWRSQGERHFIVFENPHCVQLAGRDPELKAALLRASLVLPDGIGITVGASLLGYHHCGRIPGPSFMFEVVSKGREFGFRHFFYGGGEGVPERVARNFVAMFPGVQVAGTYSPPFRPLSGEEDAAAVQRINRARPDVVWVALGAPKQEKWMAAHLGRITAPAMVGVGAAFDFHGGIKRRAPAWMQRCGFEWMFRSCQEWRMLKRNLDIPVFFLNVFHDAIRLRLLRLNPTST